MRGERKFELEKNIQGGIKKEAKNGGIVQIE